MATSSNEDAAKSKAKAEADAASAARARVTSGANELSNDAKPNHVGRTAEAEANNQRLAALGGGDIVMVGCKLPHGLTISLSHKVENDEGKPVWQHYGEPVTLAGANASQIIGGFGITPVPAEFWNAWLEQNKRFPAVLKGLIFAENKRERAMDHAIEHKSEKTGAEPIDPDKPGKGLTKVTQEEQRRAGGT